MIASDEEVRRAAERVALAVRHVDEGMSEGESFEIVYGDQCGQFREDMRSLANGVLAELDRRDQEAAERALPIDEEWLASIGWVFRGVFWYYSLPNKRQLVMSQTFSESDVLIKNVASPQFVGLGKMQNRGQLIDLLAALKGGAS